MIVGSRKRIGGREVNVEKMVAVDDKACHQGSKLKGKNEISKEEAKHEDEGENDGDTNEEDDDYINLETKFKNNDYDI